MSFGFVRANWLLPNYSKSPFVKKKTNNNFTTFKDQYKLWYILHIFKQ